MKPAKTTTSVHVGTAALGCPAVRSSAASLPTNKIYS